MCKNLYKIINETLDIAGRHLDEHMYYTGLNNKEALQDFVDKYSFIVKETYCDLCEDNKNCEEYKDYLKYKEWNYKN
jgi:hypothetical protein